MKVYRIAKQQYLNDLSGEGARLFGGRWNKRGWSMLYFSETLPLALLEILVHTDFKYLTPDFGYIEAELPDDLVKQLHTKDLEPHWRNNPPPVYTQSLGCTFLKEQDSLALQVPSAVLPFGCNILINPKHPKIDTLKIINTGTLDVDARVFK